MKIGFVLDDGLDKPDGVQQYILTLGAYYANAGHDVRYLVGQTSRKDLEGVFSLAKNIKVRFNGNTLSNPLPASSKEIKRVLKQEKFDVLHVQIPYHPFFGAKVVRLADASTAVVGTFHILPYGKLSVGGTRLLGMWLKRSLRRFDAFVCVSAPAAVFAKKTFRITSTVIPNSVPLAVFQPAKPIRRSPDTFNLLFLGRLVPRKGCQQLLKALAILQQSNCLPEHLQVDICGGGPLLPELKRYVKQHKLSGIVTFHGFVSHEQKIAQMQAADIAVFPSLSGESFGIVLIEAMAAGSGVVIGGDNPGYRSVLEPVPGSIIDAHWPTVFAEQLYDLMADKEKRASIHRKQQILVKQFDTPVVAEQLLELYKTCKSNRIS